MKYVDEYRDPLTATKLRDALAQTVTRPWTIMEICGGQTHAILRFGVDQLLPPEISLLHGPGCPVCVTPADIIDHAIAISKQPDVILCSFGDMIRVPGNDMSLMSAKAEGADVRIVYSPLDAVALAQQHPDRQVVFFAVGFETTAPTTAAAVMAAHKAGLQNFSLLTSHVRVPPAIEALLSAQDHGIDGFLAAGHVCTVMGLEEYVPLAERYRLPIVATGFEPMDILQGVLMCAAQLESGRAQVENQYGRAVRPEGNRHAQSLMDRVFKTIDQSWRGLGVIPGSGLGLNEEYHAFDAALRFKEAIQTSPPVGDDPCLSGMVLQGQLRPDACPLFGQACTPEHPKGATMVSSEGACAAYYKYRRKVNA